MNTAPSLPYRNPITQHYDLQNQLSKQVENHINFITSFYDTATPETRKIILLKLLNISTASEKILIYNEIVPHVCRTDFIQILPPEITLPIFKYLDSKSLCNSNQVSKAWNSISKDDSIWHPKCHHDFPKKFNKNCIKCDSLSNQLASTIVPKDAKMWKNLYAKKYALERNWRKGIYTNHEFMGHSSYIFSIQVNEKLRILVTGSKDKTIRVWDIESGKCIKVLKGHTNVVRCLQFDESKIVSGSYDGTVKIWDFKSFECIKTLHSDMRGVSSVHFRDNILAAGCRGGIKVWNLNDYSSFELRDHTHWVTCVQVVSSNLLLSSSYDHTVRLWNLNTISVLQSFDNGYRVSHFKLLLSPVQSNANEWTSLPPGKLITSCEDGTLKIYDTQSGHLLNILLGHCDIDNWVDADDSRIISVSDDLLLIIWNIDSGEIMHKFKLKNFSYGCQLTKTGIWSSDDGSVMKHWNFKHLL